VALRIPRRKVLKAAIASGALALVGGAVAFFRTRGYEPSPGTRLVALSAAEGAILVQVARRICAGDADAPTADDVGVVAFIDAYAAHMPAHLRRDLGRFLVYIEQLAPLGIGIASRFTTLASVEQDAVLASLEASSSDLFRGGFESVKALVFMGYYRDPRTWKILGYDGPLLGREP
jgi:hypothetical protein